MAAVIVRSWRGVLRGQLQQVKRRLTSLLNYGAKHPTSGFLSAADVIILQAALNLVVTKLGATKPR